uniref:hypothetical protein n=1 Tax=Flavobacterium sp. TaxID=239 RepID=UPI00404AF132
MIKKAIALLFLLLANLLFCQTSDELAIVAKLDSLSSNFKKTKQLDLLNAYIDYLNFNVENATISLAEIERQVETFRLLYKEKKYTIVRCRIDFIEAIVYKKLQNYPLFEKKLDAIKEKLKITNSEASLLETLQFNYLLASHLYNNQEEEKAKEILLENEKRISENPHYFAKFNEYEIYSNTNTLSLIYSKKKIIY